MMIYLINQGTLLCLSCFFQLKVLVCVLVLVSSILAVYMVSNQYRNVHREVLKNKKK